jgi:hypothetical protein
MKLLKEIYRKENGQAFVLVLILLLVGMLIIVPLLALMSTGLISARTIDDKTDEVYAADAGIEDALNKIVTDDALFAGIDEGESDSYTLTDPVNGETNITVTVNKLGLLEGILGEDELIHLEQPHEEWVSAQLDIALVAQTEDYREYTATMSFIYDPPQGNKSPFITSAGAFFSPITGGEGSVDGPYNWLGTETGIIEWTGLEADSPEVKFVGGGISFIWRFENPGAPRFDDDNPNGSFDFTFKVYDPTWQPTLQFIWVTIQSQDISFWTNAPGYFKWVIEATAGDTTVRSAIIEVNGSIDVLTWEIDPPA